MKDVKKLITFACVEGKECPKIDVDSDKGIVTCLTYLDPNAVQCRMGRKDACGIKAVLVDDAVVQGKKRAGQQKQKRNC